MVGANLALLERAEINRMTLKIKVKSKASIFALTLSSYERDKNCQNLWQKSLFAQIS